MTRTSLAVWVRRSAAFALLSAFVLPSAAIGARAPLAQERASFLGPEEGETLTSWTERWLDGPVQYIATEEEKRIYGSLGSTIQRLQFIRLFWERRDPTYRGPENEAVEEFVRRVEYADEEFSEGGEPGWKSVFGRVVLVLGPPARTERQLGFPSSVSTRPVILWGYDERLPDWPVNEMLMFVFQRGRWRLAPPSNFNEPPGVTAAQRDLERFNMLSEIPNDFVRTTDALIQESLVQTVNYNNVVEAVEADVAFPDAEIPFAWEASYVAGEGDDVDVTLTLSWRMESLVFHVVDQDYQTDMVVGALLFNDDGEPVAETTERFSVMVPVAELAERSDEIVERTLSLSAPPGTYRLRIALDDQLLGYRSVYTDDITVPSR